MRIISGAFKGKKLVSMRGNATRPTSDRVREAIFNILTNKPDADLCNASVLDLFAGTGALGLEALSRGAASAVFIDSSPMAVSIIQKNILACRTESRARVIRWDIAKNLHCLRSSARIFDLVFMDPPYNNDLIAPTLQHLTESKTITAGATLIIEHSADETAFVDLPAFQLTDRRVYGKTLVSFLSPVLQKQLP